MIIHDVTLPGQFHRQVEKVILEIPAVVGCSRDVMGDLFQGDMQEPVGQLSDIGQDRRGPGRR